jgi:hypothetical protein
VFGEFRQAFLIVAGWATHHPFADLPNAEILSAVRLDSRDPSTAARSSSLFGDPRLKDNGRSVSGHPPMIRDSSRLKEYACARLPRLRRALSAAALR